jgi:hypothetical protein
MEANLGKSGKLIINAPNGLLEGLLERPPDTHDLTNAFHAAAKQSANATELFQVPSWNFDNDIIHARLKARTCDFGDGILDLIERDAEPEFCGNECERVTSRFRC